jgi:hypothetical protein
MADDWQAGDLALCVKTRHPNFDGASSTLRRGARYKVVRPFKSSDPRLIEGEVALVLEGARPRINPGWPSGLFIKITPKAPDAEDAETIRLLTGVPAKEPAA